MEWMNANDKMPFLFEKVITRGGVYELPAYEDYVSVSSYPNFHNEPTATEWRPKTEKELVKQ